MTKRAEARRRKGDPLDRARSATPRPGRGLALLISLALPACGVSSEPPDRDDGALREVGGEGGTGGTGGTDEVASKAPEGGAGGQSASGEGGAGGSSCALLDGTCAIEEQEAADPCACSDCDQTALCKPDQCVDDGACTLADACTCSDCAMDPYCQTCDGDGACFSFTEGCGCSDCATLPACAGQGG